MKKQVEIIIVAVTIILLSVACEVQVKSSSYNKEPDVPVSCLRGVEYYKQRNRHDGHVTYVPAFKADGSLFTCKVENNNKDY